MARSRSSWRSWLDLGLRVLDEVRTASDERDRLAGRTERRAEPPTRRVERGVRVEYRPDRDGDADPGEVVWAWVPFEDDPARGKDRPVVVIGRATGEGRRLAGVPLTSKRTGRPEDVSVGTGGWDARRRESWAKTDRLLLLDEGDVRREGAALVRDRFDLVVDHVARHHALTRS